MKRLWIGLGSIALIGVAGSLIYISLPEPAPVNTSHAYEYYYVEETKEIVSEPEDILPAIDKFSSNPGKGMSTGLFTDIRHPQPVIDTDPASVTVLVNHLYTLPADYIPENLVVPDVPFTFTYMDDKRLMRSDAASALEELFADAWTEDIHLTAISGYRSYTRQNHIYLNNVRQKGEDYANLYSAPPGHSEHQTGLTMDVSSASNHFNLTHTLADLPEGIWIKENSHRFGFIIRYPEEKEAITGYAYEPWHLRYVGIDLATYLYEHDLTLDEYYGVSAEEYEWTFDFDAAWDLLFQTTPPEEEELPEEEPLEAETFEDDVLEEDPMEEEMPEEAPMEEEDPMEEVPENEPTEDEPIEDEIIDEEPVEEESIREETDEEEPTDVEPDEGEATEEESDEEETTDEEPLDEEPADESMSDTLTPEDKENETEVIEP